MMADPTQTKVNIINYESKFVVERLNNSYQSYGVTR